MTTSEPPTSGSSKAKASKRRDEILAVAARIIAERGLAGATVRDIGEAAGILSGSLYHHFESKEEIVLDLLLDDVATEVTRAKSLAAEAPDAKTAVAQLIGAIVEQTAAHPSESLILRNETRAFAELEKLAPLAALRRETIEVWISVIRRGIADGEFDPSIDAEVAVMSIVDSALGTSRWFGSGSSRDADTVASTLVATHLRGIVID